MNDNMKQALEKIYDEESAQYQIGELIEFSPKFEREMEKLIGKKKPARSVSKHAFKAITIAAAAAALFGISLTAGAAATQGFTEKMGYSKDFKQPVMSLAAAGAENSPQLIEDYYAPTLIPETVKRYSRSVRTDHAGKNFSVYYVKELDDMLNEDAFCFMKCMIFTQYTKDSFSTSFEVPAYVEVSKTTVNGHPAYLIWSEHYYGNETRLVWDSGDYIMSLVGDLTVDEVKRIAESVAEADDDILAEVKQG